MLKRFYLSTRLDRIALAAPLLRTLAARGWERTFDWDGQDISTPGELADLAVAELTGIREADVFIVLLPGGRGTHIEIGAALALGKPVILYAPDRETLVEPYRCAFYYHPGVKLIVSEVLDVDAILAFLTDGPGF
jgi:nucleoside 2-deoxyribosyltransferase